MAATSERESEATPSLELIFDLVFAFAVSQLSQHLVTHLSWRGAAETLVMLMAIFGVWFTTSWSATIIPVEQSRTRRLVLAVTLLGLFMNAAVTKAFTTSGWAFAIPLVVIQVGRAVWTLVHSPTAVFREHYVRTLLWVIVTAPLWVAGAAVEAESRLLWWVLAVGIDEVGRWLAHPIPGRRLHSENVAFDAGHMLERCRLFLIIALGETVLTTGAAIADAAMTLMTLATGTFALVGTVALWALSFGRSHRLILQHLKQTSNPILASRHAVNALTVMVVGLIAIAVANKEVIAHPLGHTSVGLSLMVAGGPIMFLAAQGWYLWVAPKFRSRLHLIGGVALLLVGFATIVAPPFIALLLVSATVSTLAIVGR